MDETQRAAALEAREQAKAAGNATAAAARPTSGGLTGMVMPTGPGRGAPGMGVQGGGSRNAALPPGSGSGQRGLSGREAMSPPKPLWFIDETGKPNCILVQTGISNGSFTEIRTRGEDLDGRQIILRERVQL